jgi:hypothetical protein
MRWSSGPCTARARTSLYVGRSGTGSGHTRRLVVPGGSCVIPREHPRHLVRQAAESLFSLPVATDKTSLRRPVNATFRQKTPQSLLPPRSRPSHRPTEPLTEGRDVRRVVSRQGVLGGSPIGVAGARTGRLSRSPVPRRRARTLHPKLGDGVLADLGLQSSEDG